MTDTPRGRVSTNGINTSVLTAELAKHDVLLTGLGGRVSGVEVKIDSIISKLDQVTNVLAITQSRPQIIMKDLLQNLTMGATLLGGAVAAILYVSSSSFGQEITTVKTKHDADFASMESQIAGVKERSTIFNSEVKAAQQEIKENQQNSLLNLRERLSTIERYLMYQTQPRRIVPDEPQPQVFKPLPDVIPQKRSRDERQL